MDKIAETERLIITKAEDGDIEDIISVWTDDEVMKYMGGSRDPDKVRDAIVEAIASGPQKMDIWMVKEKETMAYIGDCGLIEKKVDGVDEIEIIYIIGKEQWGKGYASEASSAIRDYAFVKLKQPRLVALIDPENEASERVAQKIGMRHEKDTVRESGKRMRVYSIENSQAE